MIDAAVPIEAVQGNVIREPAMIYSTWQNYSNRLYASDWWRLFPATDDRSTLTWSNRLGNLRSVDVYNFYSEGEEVLRTYSQDPNSTITTTVALELYYRALGLPFGTYCWVWEEKGKGTYDTDGFVGSKHGGWRFSNTSYYYNDYDGTRMAPAEANEIDATQLQAIPFFSFNAKGSLHPDSALLENGGSAYAKVNRDRILSDAIPAMTLPIGANLVASLDEQAGEKRNFDMQQEFKTGWPEDRSNTEELKWHHSDFDYVAYPFIHSLFDNIVNIGNLKN